MQAFAFRRKESVRLGLRRRRSSAERMALFPESKVKPGPPIGRAGRRQAEQTGDGALRPDRGRVARADTWETAITAFISEHGDLSAGVDKRHVYGTGIPP